MNRNIAADSLPVSLDKNNAEANRWLANTHQLGSGPNSPHSGGALQLRKQKTLKLARDTLLPEMKLLILRKQHKRVIEEGGQSLDSHDGRPHQVPESPLLGDDLGSSANDEAVRQGCGGEPRTAKSMVAFSESEGEEYVEIGQVRALQAEEVRLIRRKFWKRCDFCATVKPPRTHHCS